MSNNLLIALAVSFTSLAIFTATSDADTPYDIAWAIRAPTDKFTVSNSVTVDNNGDVYITGHIDGRDPDIPFSGYNDIFLAKYSSSGALLWTEQLGAHDQNDEGFDVVCDDHNNVYITGRTWGSIGGQGQGYDDVFIAKYSSGGTQQWIKQFGSDILDYSFSIAVDPAGDLLIAGYTWGSLGGPNAGGEYGPWDDLFLAKYDASGNQKWIKQYGTKSVDRAYSMAVDNFGNAYLCGETTGDFGRIADGYSYDALLVKIDPAGNLLWAQQPGTNQWDKGWSVAVGQSGDIYISGESIGNIDNSQEDIDGIFAARYNPAGDLIWIKQFFGTGNGYPCTIALDNDENIYINSNVHVDYDDNTNEYDFPNTTLVKLNQNGQLLWCKEYKEFQADSTKFVTVDNDGNAYISGSIAGLPDTPTTYGGNAFLVKYSPPVPCNSDLPVDFNCDGRVSLIDLDILGKNWAVTGLDPTSSFEKGDANGDGRITLADLDIFGQHWGNSTIPEPTSLSILSIGLLLTIRRH